MRRPRPLVLAGAAALAAGLGVAALAEAPKVHVLHVALPDGSVRTVRYTGDVPPRLVLVRVPVVESPFAALDRMAAMMDVQAARMMQQVSAMAARPVAATPGGGMQLAALADAPAGARYSYTTTTVVNGRACTTAVQATSLGAGRQPQRLGRRLRQRGRAPDRTQPDRAAGAARSAARRLAAGGAEGTARSGGRYDLGCSDDLGIPLRLRF